MLMIVIVADVIAWFQRTQHSTQTAKNNLGGELEFILSFDGDFEEDIETLCMIIQSTVDEGVLDAELQLRG